MRKNKITALIVMLMFALSFMAPAAYASNINDINGHWAEASIKQMVDKGNISGYPDASFKPDGNITRAEFASLIVRGFNLSANGGKIFADTANHWAKDLIAIANANNIVNGYSDTTFGPDDSITREQMAVMIVKAAGLTDAAKGKDFADSSSIADWAKNSVAIATGNNLISGYSDNTFKPQGKATRAEAAVVLSKSTPTIIPPVIEPVKPDYSVIDKAGTYGPKTGSETVTGNVTVKAQDTTLQNLVIKGDLIIAKEVGNGDVILNNIKVQGKTYIRGGGKDSIHINGGEYRDIIVESTATGAVRIVATNAQGLQVIIYENAQGEEIILKGEFKNVIVNASDVKITAQANTTIGEVKVVSGLKDVDIELAENSTVKEMVLNSKAEVKGTGTIIEASGTHARESTYQTAPDRITSSSSGGGSSGGTTTVDVSAISVDKVELTLAVGGKETLTVTVEPPDATNQNVAWSTSDGNVATVDAKGLVTAIKVGTAIITAKSDNGKIANCAVTVKEHFAFGSGTASEPYQVSSPVELNNVRYYLGRGIYFKQTADIDLSAYNTDEGWISIGTSDAGFKGIYDGGGNIISGLTINRPGVNYQGLFGYVDGVNSELKNINLTEVNVEGYEYVGGLVGNFDSYGKISNCSVSGTIAADWYVGVLAGQSSSVATITNSYATGTVIGNVRVGGLVGDNEGTIENSYATGAVSGNSYIGGLIGRQDGGTIKNSYARGAVTGKGDYIGGLVGWQNVGTIENSYATGTVSGDNQIGGLVGQQREGTIKNSYATGAVSGANSQIGGLVGGQDVGKGIIENSYATGAVKGNSQIGGLIGRQYTVNIVNSYAWGAVSGDNHIGGLVGRRDSGTIENSYATGAVSSNSNSDYIGGLIGNRSDVASGITSSYYDITTTLQPDNGNGEGKTTAEMKKAATFSDDGWDKNIWNLVDGAYPTLKYQSE